MVYSKEKNCQPRMLYLTKILFRNKGEINIFQTKAEGFIAYKPTLKKCYNEFFRLKFRSLI